MDLELHQLDRRYEALRTRQPARERRLLASIAEAGQKTPIVVVRDGERYAVVDGYKRVRALSRLGHDTVRALEWALSEVDALLLDRTLRAREGDTPLEQGWLLRELHARFGLSGEELARRFDRSPSWVSARLGLVRDLPDEVQDLVRTGAVGAHGAMKYLVPFARANRADCIRLAGAIAPLRVSSRQLGQLYAAYQAGEAKTKELVLSDPGLVLRAQLEAGRARAKERSPAELLVDDFAMLGSVARRAHRRLRDEGPGLGPGERDELRRCATATWVDLAALWRRLDKEVDNARPEGPDRNPGAQP
jgi:ParB family chromosome partitioning protein